MYRSHPTLSSSHARAAGRGIQGLLLLGVLILAGPGCTSSTEVTRDPAGYRTITKATVGETARVSLRDGRTMELKNVYVTADSTVGISPQGNERSVSTSAVQKIEMVSRGAGTILGAGIGALPLATVLCSTVVDLVWGKRLVEGQLETSFVLWGLLTTPLGAVIGAIRGARETYRLPESARADSTSTVLRPSTPEPRRREVGQP